MFLLIPLLLIVISMVGVGVIVYRKLPYLRKLSPESHQVGAHLADDYFPELMTWMRTIPWHEYRKNILHELEKGVRRMRLVLLKIDHLSDRLIKKIRRSHITAHVEQLSQTSSIQDPGLEVVPKSTEPTAEDLKAREQQLIIDISQDPKNPVLYETLGDLYVKMNSIEDAKEAYEAALGFSPDNQVVARKYSTLLKKSETAVS
jgi:hypothetical protein